MAERLESVKAVMDLGQRFREMDSQAGDYRQIITLPHPALEEVTSPQQATRLAGLANDGLAELCRRYPERFPAFVAAVSLTDVEATVAEAQRAALLSLGRRVSRSIPMLRVARWMTGNSSRSSQRWRNTVFRSGSIPPALLR